MSITSRNISSRVTERPFSGEASCRFTPLNFTCFPLTWIEPSGMISVFMNPTLHERMSSPACRTSV